MTVAVVSALGSLVTELEERFLTPPACPEKPESRVQQSCSPTSVEANTLLSKDSPPYQKLLHEPVVCCSEKRNKQKEKKQGSHFHISLVLIILCMRVVFYNADVK